MKSTNFYFWVFLLWKKAISCLKSGLFYAKVPKFNQVNQVRTPSVQCELLKSNGCTWVAGDIALLPELRRSSCWNPTELGPFSTRTSIKIPVRYPTELLLPKNCRSSYRIPVGAPAGPRPTDSVGAPPTPRPRRPRLGISISRDIDHFPRQGLIMLGNSPESFLT